MNSLDIELNWTGVATAVVVLILTSIAVAFFHSSGFNNKKMADNISSSHMKMEATSGPQHEQEQQHEEIAHLLQYARSSYTSNPTDALSALMGALTLSSGNAAAHVAMERIRSELGDAVADSISSSSSSHYQQQQHQQHYSQEESMEMTRRAMEIVEQLLNDKSTFLYAQGRQHLLQQAMEDGSSVVCTKCGDMIKADRIEQHVEYWCRNVAAMEENDKSCCPDGDVTMGND